jgi:hypothetical protein
MDEHGETSIPPYNFVAGGIKNGYGVMSRRQHPISKINLTFDVTYILL